MDSPGDPTTARLSPVASTSSYFLQLDPTSGRIEIVDSSLAQPNRSMDLGDGDETVYEIRDEDYFLTGQFMDPEMTEMDPVVDISDLLIDKPMQGFLPDEPAQGTSFNNFSPLTSTLSGYEEIKGSERDTVQQAIDEAYVSGSLTDAVILGEDENDNINNMIYTATSNPDDNNAQVQTQEVVTSGEISGKMFIDQTPVIPIPASMDKVSSLAITESKVIEMPPKVVQSEPVVIRNVSMQDIAMNIIIKEHIMPMQRIQVDNLSSKSNEIAETKPTKSEPKIIPKQHSTSFDKEIGPPAQTSCVSGTETEIVEEVMLKPEIDSSTSRVPTSESTELEQEGEYDVVVDPDMDFEIKIVSCYSEYKPEIIENIQVVPPVEVKEEIEILPTNSEPEASVAVDVSPKLEPEIVIKTEVENPPEPEEQPLLGVPAQDLEEDLELEEPAIVGRIPEVPEWLYGKVDPNDELLLAYKSRPDPMMTVICVFCYTWFPDKDELQQHIITEHAKKKSKFHKCRVCDAKFVARVLRIRHEKLHRYDLKHPWCMYFPKSRPYDSLVKNHFTKRFRSAPLSDSYRSHLEEVFNKVDTQPYECNACADAFADEESVREHYERSHALQSCRFCGKVPGNLIDARKHEKEVHGQYEIESNYDGGAWNFWEHWRCEESLEKQELLSNIDFFHSYRKRLQDEPAPFEEEFITREFPTTMNFEDHFQDQERLLYGNRGEISFFSNNFQGEGDDIKLFQSLAYRCDICPKSYDNEHDLRRHARCHSIERHPLACQFCGKGFKTHSHKKEHERTHTNEKPYCCPICNRSFIQSSNLKKHIQTHKSLNTLQCEICSKQFIKESSLILHQRAHALDRKFRCTICDRAYNYASLLKRHMRIHTGETPYNCDVCGMLFHELVSLHYHKKKVHTGERPHCCETCGRAFILSSDLKKHVQIHLKLPSEKAPKKPTKRNRAFISKTLDNNIITLDSPEDEESQNDQKPDTMKETKSEESQNELDIIEDMLLGSEEESASEDDEEVVKSIDKVEIEDVPAPAVEKPALRVYQRREVKVKTPPKIVEEIQEDITKTLPVLENHSDSHETAISPTSFSAQSLNNHIIAPEECGTGLYGDVMMDVMNDESLATVELDQNGQQVLELDQSGQEVLMKFFLDNAKSSI